MASASILIIEDDETLLRGLKDNFQKKGFSVSSSQDGQSGLRAAIATTPDVILLDIMLPNLNGYEICRELRSRKIDSTIIMLTAKGQETDIVRGLELGADDYVTKPFSIHELLARVNAFLRRRQSSTQEEYTFGECSFDLVAHKLFRAGQEIRLTSKEYRLLEYLIRRRGAALTRTDILNAVWGSSVIVTARSVDRCVTTLRSKIEIDPKRPRLIRTIRDVGYRFELD